jgi:hypothetical protein
MFGQRWTDMAYIQTHIIAPPHLGSPLSLNSHWNPQENDALDADLNAAVSGNTFFLDPERRTSIPSDVEYHEITLGTINMNAEISLCVRPGDERVYLKVNESTPMFELEDSKFIDH